MCGCIGNIKIDELGYLLFPRYDSRVKAMEVDERPTEQYSDIGGLDQQIQEVNMINKQTNKQTRFCGDCLFNSALLSCFTSFLALWNVRF